MRLVKHVDKQGQVALGSIQGDEILPLDLSGGQYSSLADIFEADDPLEVANLLSGSGPATPLAEATILPPIDQQEVWAAGVTYKRSQTARMEESEAAADCYDRVYMSPRPEIFFKATPHRVSGPGQPVRIRTDSNWDVPEPELALVLNSRLDLVGFTIGNDMSSRDIEGENPLYLPQAKLYDQCCGLGPCVTLAQTMHDREKIGISLTIRRDGADAFHGETSVAEMVRSFEDLIGWLRHDNSFPTGAFLLTGTGVVPDSDFTLQGGDEVEIRIDGIGSLINPVVRG